MTKRSLVAAGVLAMLTIAVPVAMQQAGQTTGVRRNARRINRSRPARRSHCFPDSRSSA